MSYKSFCIFSYGGQFNQRSGTILSILCRESHKEHFCEINLKSVLWSGKRCHLKVFLLLALAAILFSGAERFKQFRKKFTQGTFI